MLDGRKKLTGVDEDPDPKKPKSAGARSPSSAREELAWGCAGIALALGGSGLAASPVARMGTEEQKEEFRTPADGRRREGPRQGRRDGALRARDRLATSPASRPPRAATATTGSSAAASSGSRTASRAAVYVVWAQTDRAAGRAGVRGFIVARGTPGLVPGKKETKLGIRASETAQVHFEDVRVHKDMMLGIARRRAAGGLADTKKMLDSTRPVVGAQAVGIARAAYEFLLERVQGGIAARHADGEPPAHHVRARRDADGDHGVAHARAPRGVDGRSPPRERRRGVDGEGARRAHRAVR